MAVGGTPSPEGSQSAGPERSQSAGSPVELRVAESWIDAEHGIFPPSGSLSKVGTRSDGHLINSDMLANARSSRVHGPRWLRACTFAPVCLCACAPVHLCACVPV